MKYFRYMSALCALLLMASCLDSGDETFVLNNSMGVGGADDGLGIPYDDDSGDTPAVDPNGGGGGGGDEADDSDGNGDGDIPNWPVVITDDGYGYVSLTGIRDPQTRQWLTLSGTGKPGQNVWLDIDGKAKSVDAYNLFSAVEKKYPVRHDVVFLINDSYTMSSEIEHISPQITSWAAGMEADGIDLRVGIVAYGEGNASIRGAIDITEIENVEAYLSRGTGASRVEGFGGSNADGLEAAALGGDYYSGYSNECAVVAMKYANANFNFRRNSNRIYILLTDEPNQPGSQEKWSTEILRPAETLWQSQYGTVHTVYGGELDFVEQMLHTEKPWRLSRYTGGTVQYYDDRLQEVELSDFTVGMAMKHSYLLRFRMEPSYRTSGKVHTVRVTVKTPDGHVQRQKTKNMEFFVD